MLKVKVIEELEVSIFKGWNLTKRVAGEERLLLVLTVFEFEMKELKVGFSRGGR
jgi:hypothetical protein